MEQEEAPRTHLETLEIRLDLGHGPGVPRSAASIVRLVQCRLWAMRDPSPSFLLFRFACAALLCVALSYSPAFAADGDQQIGQLHTCKLANGREISDCFL